MAKQDLSLWNRKDRRKFKAMKIPGRTLPYSKAVFGSTTQYNALRDKELSTDKDNG